VGALATAELFRLYDGGDPVLGAPELGAPAVRPRAAAPHGCRDHRRRGRSPRRSVGRTRHPVARSGPALRGVAEGPRAADAADRHHRRAPARSPMDSPRRSRPLKCDLLVLVDVGGDVVARADEPRTITHRFGTWGAGCDVAGGVVARDARFPREAGKFESRPRCPRHGAKQVHCRPRQCGRGIYWAAEMAVGSGPDSVSETGSGRRQFVVRVSGIRGIIDFALPTG
jgi:hypothetical protein